MSENPGTQQRLLIVDDSKVIRVTARKILQKHFTTVEALDGNDAWQKLESEPPFALAVSDLTMPGMDGFELLQKIRHSQQPHIRDLPVIIITGANDSEATMQRAKDAGATDFIGKPFDAVHLLARTQSHCNAYLGRQSLTEQNISLEDQVRHDPVTGLANEAGLMEQGYQLLSHAIRHHTGFAVAQIEIDGYDRIYRDYGEKMAETVIKYAAGVLQSSIRGEDMLARTGPARFALLLSCMHPEDIHHLTNRISGDIRKRSIRSGADEIRFTASIGVCAPEIMPDTRFETLLKTARDNLQKALARGGGTVESDDFQADIPIIQPAAPIDSRGPAADARHGTAGVSGFNTADIDEEIQLTVAELPGATGMPDQPDNAAAREPATAFSHAGAEPAPAAASRTQTPFPAEFATGVADDEIIITAPFSMFDEEKVAGEPADAATSQEPAADTGPAGELPGQAMPRAAAVRPASDPAGGLLASPGHGEETAQTNPPGRGFLARLFGIFARHDRQRD